MKGNAKDKQERPDDDTGGAAVDEPEASEEGAVGLEAVAPPENDIDGLKREVQSLRDQLLRRRAEFENFRRRTEREREQAGLERAAQVLKALIPTIDNLERALGAAAEADPLKQGVEMIYKELMALLTSSGVTVEDPVGQPFDPLRHQALATEPAPGHEDGTVVEVFRKGYALKDRLLRPALVKVAQGAGDHENASRGEKVH